MMNWFHRYFVTNYKWHLQMQCLKLIFYFLFILLCCKVMDCSMPLVSLQGMSLLLSLQVPFSAEWLHFIICFSTDRATAPSPTSLFVCLCLCPIGFFF